MMKQMKLKLSGLAVILLSANPLLADQAFIYNMGGSQTNIAQITQYGGIYNNNYGKIYQDYDALSEHAYITQAGAGDQYAYVYQNGTCNEVNITQNGIQGAAFIYEGYDCYDSDATIVQDGGSINAFATIIQNNGYGYGANNDAYIHQNSLTGDQATITQAGGGNYASTMQENNTGLEMASSTQSGDYNQSIISQNNGASDQVNIQQNGFGNQGNVQQLSTYFCNVSLDQNGASNIASIDQSGSFKVATITQTGSGNSTTIIQH